ncbi:MAG TPA: aldehyde dehydrogenase family protein, partial [Planctomycetia bacterium]|nr:aldehyde dehydrogenase family protein [Planctomycetia bacterium]
PALVVDPPAGSKLLTEEVFGPAVSVLAYDDIEAAIAAANDTRFGLAAGIFTRDVGRALAFIKGVRAGNLHVNWGPGWRADLMPYGGLKDSGIGKEGPADAILEMTEEKTVIFHP